MDNCSDNYHVPTTHLSHHHRAGAPSQTFPRLTHEQQFQSENKHLFVNGHSLTLRFLEREDQARQTHGVTGENREAFEEYYRRTLPEAERTAGQPARAEAATGQPQPVSQRRAGVASGASQGAAAN